MSDDLRCAALDYHRSPSPGKISVDATKPPLTQRDLALADSPGAANACEAIVEDPQAASRARIAFAEGEDERVLHAAQVLVEERIAMPVLVGRASVIAARLTDLGMRLTVGRDIEVVDCYDDDRVHVARALHRKMLTTSGAVGDPVGDAVNQDTTAIAALLLRTGNADGMICGVGGLYPRHLRHVREIIGLAPARTLLAAMNHLILSDRALFICDTYVNENPDAGQLAEIAAMAVEAVIRLGIKPRVAMLSHSDFGESSSQSARKMAEAARLLRARMPNVEIDGEMRGETALSQDMRAHLNPASPLTADANILVMPNIEAASIAYGLLQMASGGGVTVGPILLGADRPVHVLTRSATVRRVVNMAEFTAAAVRK